MHKIIKLLSFIILLIIVDNNLAYSQLQVPTHSIDINLDEDLICSLEYFSQVEKFNNQKHAIQKRNQYSFKLDSASTIYPGYYKGKTVYNLSDSVEFAFGWDYNEDLNDWVPRGMAVYHYSKKGLLKKQTYNNWNGSYSNISEENPSLIRDYKYNENGQIVWFKSRDDYDISLGKYSNLYYYYYDSLDRLIHLDQNNWFNGEDTVRHVADYFYKYNNSDQLIESKYFNYNKDQSISQGDSIYIYYKENGLKDYADATAFTTGGNIFGIWRLEYLYNEEGNIIQRNSFIPNENGSWDERNTFDYEYHKYGSLESITFSSSTTNRKFEKTVYTHNPEVYKSDIKLNTNLTRWTLPDPEQDEEVQLHMLLREEKYRESSTPNQNLEIEFIVDYYYSKYNSTSTLDTPADESQLIISPNPSTGFINLDVPDYQGALDLHIIAVDGQLISQQKKIYRNQIDISYLDSGIYFFVVYYNGQKEISRFIKR